MSIILTVLAGFVAVVAWVIVHAWFVFPALALLWVACLVAELRPLGTRTVRTAAGRAARALHRRRTPTRAPARLQAQRTR